MADTTNYIPKRPKSEIEIPEFLQPQTIKPSIKIDDSAKTLARDIAVALEKGKIANEQQNNMFHLKELDKVADAYTADEARVIVKRIVSNYPDIVLGEVVNLIRDMQELSASIMKNSRIFASKRGEV